MSQDPARRAMAENIGEALIEWSRIEHVWANIFRDLLFGGIGERNKKDPENGALLEPGDSAEKSERADALFFAQKSSSHQFRLIKAVGSVTLSGEPALLKRFEAVLKRTVQLSEIRNSIAHAYYDNGLIVEGGKIEITPIQMLNFGRFKRAPKVEIFDAVKDFTVHATEVYAFWEELLAFLPLVVSYSEAQ
jgi:hypothetical protein